MTFTEEHFAAYHTDGYVVIRSFFSKAEVELLYHIAINDDVMSKKSFDRTDASGLKTKLALWFSLDDSLYSKFARSERIIRAVEQILGGKVAHYHSKLMQKEPKTGGAWEWHQDYGYWYKEKVNEALKIMPLDYIEMAANNLRCNGENMGLYLPNACFI